MKLILNSGTKACIEIAKWETEPLRGKYKSLFISGEVTSQDDRSWYVRREEEEKC